MLFSECAESNGLGKLSPNGSNLVLCKGLHIKLYEVAGSLRFLTKWTVLDETTMLQWSDDGELILCGQYKRGVVHIFNVHDFEWTAFLNNGICGIARSVFTKDSRQVMTWTGQSTRITIWSLTKSETFAVLFPKFLKGGYCFSHDGKKFALVTRANNKDLIEVYSSEDWEKENEFDPGFSVKDLYVMPDFSGIVTWSSEVEYMFVVFTMEGEVKIRFSPYTNAPGLSKVAFTPTGNYVSLCSYDKKIRILHFFSWVVYHTFNYYKSLQSEGLIFLKEAENFSSSSPSPSEIDKFQVLLTKPTETSHCLWNIYQTSLLTVLKSLPHILWLWDIRKSALDKVIIMKNSIKSIVWKGEEIVWTCGDSFIYIYEQNDILVYEQILPNVDKIQCCQNHLLLQNKSQAIYAKLTN